MPHLGRGQHGNFLVELRNVMAEVSGIRRLGAASLDLAYVAAGRMDGFWEERLSPWDIAAGILLIREAGGFVSDRGGGQDMLDKAGWSPATRSSIELSSKALKAPLPSQ